MVMYIVKWIYGEESILFRYELNEVFSSVLYDYYWLFGGLLYIVSVLERFVKLLGVKMYVMEKVKVIYRKGNFFIVDIDNFIVLVRKFIIVVLIILFEEIFGDVVVDIKRNVFFEDILLFFVFKVVVFYSYFWWENIILFYNLILKLFERFFLGVFCLVGIMFYR